ncbi:MAG TPA: ABC transporter permease [Candidatus Limnocylindrales bacterium]|nr:ABC transporter permease [Candidatus Limnocylindrales bacterium]
MLSIWLRSWRRSPLLTAQFAFTIAIGMGAAAALVSLMLALGYQPLPYRDPSRLVAVWAHAEPSSSPLALSGPDIADFADATHNVFDSLGAFTFPSIWLVDRKGSAKILACFIQPSLFADLDIQPVLGRGVRLDDQPIGAAAFPVWISYRLWQTRYNGSASVIGTTVGVASSASGQGKMLAQIVGVLPDGVSIPLPFLKNATDIWYLMPQDIAARPRQGAAFFAVGRLRPGTTPQQAQAALTSVAERLEQRYTFERRKRPIVRSLEEIAQGPARQTMGLLALGVGLVFLVGCVNLAILMGVEGRRRRRDIAIRAVLGASRSRLWYEVAAEKCLLTLLSLALGVAFAFELLRILTQFMPAAGLGPSLLHPPPLNLAVLFGFAAFAIAAALVWSALLVAAAGGAAWSRTLAAAGSGLGYTGLSDATPGAGRWRLALIATQVGTGICLLAAANLAARTYAAASVANLGPGPSRTVVLSIDPRDNFVPSDAQVVEFNQQIVSRLERLPGAQAVALADLFPPPGSPVSFIKQGDTSGAEREATQPVAVSPGYFRALGIPLLFGRSFDATDVTGAEPVAVISLDMAQANWARPEQAVGSQIAFGSKFDQRYKVVGVAGDFTGYWSQHPVPTVYLPQAQAAYFCGGSVILRTSGSANAVAALAPQALDAMPIPATISSVSTIQSLWRATLTRPLARMAGMLLLALLGLSLSIQGVYAVAAGTVAARTHELAVRSVFGAVPTSLVWSVTRELALAVLVGSALGVAGALELRPLLATWLGPLAVWRTEPIAVAVLLLALAAAVGCYIPARSAARANPIDILRQG